MSKKTEKAILEAIKCLHQDVEKLQENDVRQDKIIDSQGMAIAGLQRDVMDMRNRAIAAEAKSRVPYADISARYGVGAARISQIKKQYS